jgi:hypothetical protein
VGTVVALATCTTYGFSHTATIGASPPVAGGDSVQNVNDFKKASSASGSVLSSLDGKGLTGVPVKLIRQSTGVVVATGTTDQDGFYLLPYLHTGSPESFIVVIGQGLSAIWTFVELKANRLTEVSYDVTTGRWTITSSGQ